MKASSNYHKVKPQAAVSAVQLSVYSNEVSVSKLQFYYTPMIFIALFTSEDLSAFAWKNLQKFTEKKKKKAKESEYEKSIAFLFHCAWRGRAREGTVILLKRQFSICEKKNYDNWLSPNSKCLRR